MLENNRTVEIITTQVNSTQANNLNHMQNLAGIADIWFNNIETPHRARVEEHNNDSGVDCSGCGDLLSFICCLCCLGACSD